MFASGSLCGVNRHLWAQIRTLTSTEVSTALRPFYFSVHPDLFGQHPEERAINETSLQQLSSVLQSLQSSKYCSPVTLPFYLKNRNRQDDPDSIKRINIYLKGRDIGTAVVNILKACDLPTGHLQHHVRPENNGFQTENLHWDGDEWVRVRYRHDYDFTKMDKDHPLYATFAMKQQINRAKDSLRLRNWLERNSKDALTKCQSGNASRAEIDRLKSEMIQSSKLLDIKWDCGWNSQHFRGCLLALKSLMEQHPQHMRNLEGQTLVFSHFTGISLDGHIMLFSGEVRHNWLDFIKNVKKHQSSLGRVPYYEKSLSHVLRNMKVRRRKFMPETKVGEYELNLKHLTTAVSDYFGRNRYPKNWPASMARYEIVVESEAGPLMVSPTGQFIVPSSIPGPLLINFITSNFREADERIDNYKKDKVMEESLHAKCVEELQLASLVKDDNITPELMIRWCRNVLMHKDELRNLTRGLHVSVSTYYSVLNDGVVCVPWNFQL